MNDAESKRISVSVGVSIVAHALIALLLVLAPSVLPHTDRAMEDPEFTIEIEETEDAPPELPPPEEVPPPDAEEETLPEPPPRQETARPDRVPPSSIVSLPDPRTTTITPEAFEPEVAPSDPRQEERPVETPEQRRERLRILMDPAAVAGRSFTIDGPGPSVRRGPQSAEESAGSLRPRGEAEVERELSSSLREQAMAKAYLARTRPEVRRRPDGTHVYEGHAFSATIQPDGSVSFDDRPGVQTDGFSTSGSFDLGDALMRAAGQDPYAAERQWFMDNTEELRERLEDEDRRTRMAAGLRRLRGQIARIWQDESRAPEQRRRLLFEQWAEVDDSGGGGGARGVIETFIRENLPPGSEGAYTGDELRRLNAGRASGDRFDPYGG